MTVPAIRGQPAVGRCARCNGAPPKGARVGRGPARSARRAAVAAAWGRGSVVAYASAAAPDTTGSRDADTGGVPVDGSISPAASGVAMSYERSAPTPMKWAWQEDLELGPALDLDPQSIEGAASVSELTAVLATATANAPPRAVLTPAAHALLDAAAQRLLPYDHSGGAAAASPSPRCSAGEASQLLQAYGRVALGPAAGLGLSGSTPSSAGTSTAVPLVASVLSYVCCADGGGSGGGSALKSASARELADLLWAVSELHEDLPWEARGAAAAQDASSGAPSGAETAAAAAVTAAVPAALQRAVLTRIREQDFLAPDLCRTVCALGVLAPATVLPGAAAGGRFHLSLEALGALNEEVRYQLTEFASDFEAADLGRLILGMGRLRLGAAVVADSEYRRILMKAVYGKTRTLADKGTVDYALNRLLDDDPEARSMHFDTRWTHEELHWLPRRERDKRRIMKEGWYRTKWGGWNPGGAE